MDTRTLKLTQMAAIARHLTTTARALVLAHPGGETFIRRLEQFLGMILAPDAARARQLASLDTLLRNLDQRHDRLVRILVLMATVQAELAEEAGDPTEAEAWRALGQRLAPQGLATTQLSWLEEGELASTLPQRLEPGDRERLAAVVLTAPHGNLALLTDQLVAVGGALSLNEAERATLRAQDKRLSLARIGEARRLFGSTLKQLDASLDFHEAPAEVREVLLSKLVEALKANRTAKVVVNDEAELDALVANPPA